MNVDGQRLCARCGATRRSIAGVCHACGYDRVADVDEPTADAPEHISTEIGARPDNPINDWISRQQSRAGTIGWLARAAAGESPAALILHPMAWVVLPAVIALLFGTTVHRAYQQWPIFALALFIIPAGIIYFNWSRVRALIRSGWPLPGHPHWGWVLVALAIALRFLLTEFMPPNGPAFEEMQTGGIAFDIISGWNLPLEFRFTNLLGVVGLLAGDYTIESLRLVFRLAGALSILILALTLRRLSVSWPATLAAVFAFASLRWMVIGGGIADELFAGLLFELLLIYCLAGAATSRRHAYAWASFAGVFGGVLMYEYISYKMIILIAPAWWLWQAIRAPDAATRRSALLSGGCFALFLTLIALPAVAEIVARPTSNIHLEGVRRHIADLSKASLDQADGAPIIGAYLGSAWHEFWQYVKALSGWDDSVTNQLYRIPGEPAIFPIAGLLFTLGFAYAIWRPTANQLTRVAAIVVTACIAASVLITYTPNTGRVTPAVPILALMSGLFLDAIYQRFRASKITFFGNIGVCIAVVAVIITIGNAVSVIRMAAHPVAAYEYNNSSYIVCRAIGVEQPLFHTVHIDGYASCDTGPEHWAFPEFPPANVNSGSLPAADELRPGSLVITGERHGLLPERIDEFTALAQQTGSIGTLRAFTIADGVPAALSFCFQCGNGNARATEDPVAPSPLADPTLPAPTELVLGTRIEPDPASIDLRASATVHVPVRLISTRSVLIIPSPDQRLVAHNNPALLNRDACRLATRMPEGDTRLLIILPDSGEETASPFYLVGCAPGEATLVIESEGKILNTYRLTVAAP